ncbi:hypothetical protein J8M97_02580 [Gordonia polyisoprenivorans]|uniref:hypothetical protein n=1 Tax=Gordonia polyisoprenivorans TaxID=84595 RepID=UPI001A01A31C|nr:hypothetical protein [Gordonia polyisoprenivorans]MBE7191122.1 hypothetical protein [Gordonia polyisoprenivorans]QUD83586.1 hypothetical protein J8M97_02580 [Gordonia polyisoprenivorans]UZF55452.1 hypothetical protein LH935_22510 [Gordonia polyisoprenivorans]
MLVFGGINALGASNCGRSESLEDVHRHRGIDDDHTIRGCSILLDLLGGEPLLE